MDQFSYASLSWQGSIPRSEQYNDLYFSKAGGKEESLHNFINGNQIPIRLAKLQDQSSFKIGETGFGTGSNLWVLLENCYEYIKAHNLSLEFYSFEKYPLNPLDLKHYVENIYQINLAHYDLPDFFSLYDKLHYGENIFKFKHLTLTLYIGEIKDHIEAFASKFKNKIDAWFLDGFAPSQNPDMWDDIVFNSIFKATKEEGTFGTFTVAGIVRRGLANVGFCVQKIKGSGLKREILVGIKRSKQK